MKKYELIIFDLDGTLLDTSEGIFNSVRYAEKKMNLPPAADCNLNKFVGPPPAEMYKEIYGLDEEQALQATKFHREYGRKKAIYEAKLYPNVKNILKRLNEKGIKLAVATLKNQRIAEKILKEFGIAEYFSVIVGMDEKENLTKADTLRISLHETGSKTAVLIGDSKYDALGANDAGVDFWAAMYGFGFRKVEDLNNYKYEEMIYNFEEIAVAMDV